MEETIKNEVQSSPPKPARKKVKEPLGDRIYYIITYVILGLLAVIVIYPLWLVRHNRVLFERRRRSCRQGVYHPG